MSVALLPPAESPVESPVEAGGADNQLRFDALCRFLRRIQGRFAFVLAEFDLPGLRRETLEKLRARLADLNVVEVTLTPPPSDGSHVPDTLEQLRRLAELASPERPPDVLIVVGFESYFPEALASHDKRHAPKVARALQPLNLGRNLLKQAFPCPVVFCLPPMAMIWFSRTAPDLSSWKSAFFKFESDLDAIRAEAVELAQSRVSWWTLRQWRRREPAVLRAEADWLARLIADAESPPGEKALDKSTLARLHYRRGWMAVALGYRADAKQAFNAARQLAVESDERLLLAGIGRGQRATQKIKTFTRVSPERSMALHKVFRGAVALSEGEGLYGREEELRRLTARVTAAGERFLTLWGEMGCGKTSLALAGLVPELKRLSYFLPVIVRQWDAPVANIRRALARASGLALDDLPTLQACIQRVAAESGKTVVIICDQFEQFFDHHPQFSARRALIEEIGVSVNTSRLSCKFLFLLRTDELGRMAEFDSQVAEPLELRKRFFLPLFDAANAARVLRQHADEAGLEWPDGLIQAVVQDLTQDERVRPIEMQLVAASLAASDITTETDYGSAGRAEGLLDDYLRLVLAELNSNLRGQERMKIVLLALVDEPPRRLALTPQQIAERTGFKESMVRNELNRLAEIDLVRQAETYAQSDADEPVALYELTHDFLVELVLRATRELQDKRRQAKRVLNRALEDILVKPRHIVGLRKWHLVRKHGDRTDLAKPEVKKLLRRSLLWSVFAWSVLPPFLYFLIAVTIMGIASYTSHYKEQQRHRRLQAIPSVVEEAVRAPSIRTLVPLIESEQDMGSREAIKDRLSEVALASAKQSLPLLLTMLKNDNRYLRHIAVEVAGKVEWADKRLASQVLQSLLAAFKDSDPNVRYAVVRALDGVLADESLAPQVLQLLLTALKDSSDSVRSAAVGTLPTVLRADKGLAPQVLQLLLTALKDSDSIVRNGAFDAVGEVALLDESLVLQVLQPLLTATKGAIEYGYYGEPWAATVALGKVARAAPTQVLQPLLSTLKDGDSGVRAAAASALGQAAQVDTEARKKAFKLLTDYDWTMREPMRLSLPDFFVNSAENEAENGRDPMKFLFDHLEGRQSFLPNGNANTFGIYRDVVVSALARWLMSDKPEAEKTRAELERRLEQMRDHDTRFQLRIAASDALAEAARLKAMNLLSEAYR